MSGDALTRERERQSRGCSVEFRTKFLKVDKKVSFSFYYSLSLSLSAGQLSSGYLKHGRVEGEWEKREIKKLSQAQLKGSSDDAT